MPRVRSSSVRTLVLLSVQGSLLSYLSKGVNRYIRRIITAHVSALLIRAWIIEQAFEQTIFKSGGMAFTAEYRANFLGQTLVISTSICPRQLNFSIEPR